MAFEAKPNQTYLFSNRDKKDERHPDFKGECSVEIDGKLYTLDLAMWRKSSDRAGEYFFVSIRQGGGQGRKEGRRNFDRDKGYLNGPNR